MDILAGKLNVLVQLVPSNVEEIWHITSLVTDYLSRCESTFLKMGISNICTLRVLFRIRLLHDESAIAHYEGFSVLMFKFVGMDRIFSMICFCYFFCSTSLLLSVVSEHTHDASTFLWWQSCWCFGISDFF